MIGAWTCSACGLTSAYGVTHYCTQTTGSPAWQPFYMSRACSAWADGQHCFIAYYEHPGLNDGDAKVMSTHGIGPAACKRCLCGTEVQRA